MHFFREIKLTEILLKLISRKNCNCCETLNIKKRKICIEMLKNFFYVLGTRTAKTFCM